MRYMTYFAALVLSLSLASAAGAYTVQDDARYEPAMHRGVAMADSVWQSAGGVFDARHFGLEQFAAENVEKVYEAQLGSICNFLFRVSIYDPHF